MTRGNAVRLGLLALVWGASFLFIKLALEGLSPIQIVLARLTAGTLVLGAIVAARRSRMPRDPALWGHLAVMGITANIVPFFLFAWGEERVTSGLAGVLNGTTPLFTLALAIAVLPEERLRASRGIGLLLGFLGVVLVVGPWDQNPLTSSIPGQLACLGAAACYGLSFVYTRRLIAGRGHSPLVLAAGQLGMATLQLWVVAPFVARGPMDLTPVVVGSVVALGAVGTGLAYLLYYRLITDVGATTASTVTYLIPIVAVLLGFVVLDEPVGWNLFVGAPVVILGVAIAEGRVPLRRRAPALQVPAPGAPPPAPSGRRRR